MYYPDSEVFHVGGGALPNNNPQKLYLNYRNNLFLLYKNLPSKKRHWIVLFRMILDGASASIYLLRFSFSFFYAVLKAHIHFYLAIKTLKNKRKKLAHINDYHKEVLGTSIVKMFFIKKIKKFSNLKFS